MIGQTIAHYRVTEKIGEGGMGEVYRARDTQLGRDVAIKVLPAAFSADPDRLRRFEQEAQAAAALNHPNILAVYDIGQERLRPERARSASESERGWGPASSDESWLVTFIVSELLTGETLRARLGKGTKR